MLIYIIFLSFSEIWDKIYALPPLFFHSFCKLYNQHFQLQFYNFERSQCKNYLSNLGWVVSVCWSIVSYTKCCRFDPQWGHALEATYQCFSHTSIYLSPPFSLFRNQQNILRWGFLKKIFQETFMANHFIYHFKQITTFGELMPYMSEHFY